MDQSLFEENIHASPFSPKFHNASSMFAIRVVGNKEDDGTKSSPTGEEQVEKRDTNPFKKNRGRPKNWSPCVVTQAHQKVRDDFLRKYGTTKQAQERVVSDYQAFCTLNLLEPKFGLCDCVGQWHALAVYKPGTMDVYSGYIYSRYRSAENKRAHVACQRWHAASDVQHAPDYPFNVLMELVSRISDQTYRCFALLLLVSGLRPIALIQTLWKNFFIPRSKENNNLIAIEVRLDKTSKKVVHRKCLLVPQDMIAYGRNMLRKELGGIGDARCKDHDPESYPFAEINVNTLNATMKSIATSMGLNNGTPTSYSFRRCYVYIALKYCNYDYAKTTDYTLHFSTQVLKAHYVTLLERLKTEEAELHDSEECSDSDEEDA